MSDSPQQTHAAAHRRPAQPTDLANKIVALQRRQAAATKPRERVDRTPAPSGSSSTPRPTRAPSPRRLHAPPLLSPNIIVNQPVPSAMDADADDFSRRLKITSTSSPRPASRHHQAGPSSGSPSKLYNPNADSPRRPILTAEPEAMSDAASSSYAPRGPAPHGPRQAAPQSRAAPDSHRQLFDHRKDDPVRFSVLARPQASPNAGANRPHADRPTPTPKSSGDYVSASSTSSASYAHSTLSSNFTLSSATTDSSAPSGLFENPNARRSEDSSSSTNAFSMQLKKLYRGITALEQKILGEQRDKDPDEEGERNPQTVGILVKGRPGSGGGVAGGAEVRGGEDETEKWKRLLVDHKELAEKVQNLLALTLAPTVPASLRNIPTKYNLIARLWAHAFHRLLESLRQAASPPNNSIIALEYLQDFIYYAYTFYCALLEERNLCDFRSGWVEALGDLSRYQMAYCALVEKQQAATATLLSAPAPSSMTVLTESMAPAADAQIDTPRPSTPNAGGSSDRAELRAPAAPEAHARIDDSPPPSPGPAAKQLLEAPSVGLAAARAMELVPEKEHWRQVAREWYAKGLAGTPGAGKLHHHIGLLCRERDGSGEELRGMYHFVKSMITVHPYSTSREAILQLWSPAAQTRRQGPDADVAELYILLHGMLFTHIQMDDFRGVLDRFDEKLHIEDGAVVEERDWIMMAVINLGAILEYGRPTAVLRRIAGIAGRDGISARAGLSPAMATSSAGRVKLMAKKADEDDRKMDVDDEDASPRKSQRKPELMDMSPALSDAAAASSGPELPPSLRLGMQFAFSILAHALRKPMRKASPFARATLNPYITILLTFLATAVKDAQALAVLERFIPWADLAALLTAIPRRAMYREQQKERSESAVLLTSGCKPLPEDWCLRGLGWGGKRVYPMGFWGKEANAEDRNVEVEVLDKSEGGDQLDGIIEDEREENEAANELGKRWVRVARAGLKIAKHVDGFVYYPAANEEQRGQWKVEGALAAKVARWQEEERREREEEERRLRGRRWDEDSMDVDDDGGLAAEESTDDSEEDERDTPEIKELKARRRYLQSLLSSSAQARVAPSVPRRRPRGPQIGKPAGSTLRIVQGYTVLVVDTNILLSSLPMISTLVDSLQWTVVIPLPVIMELDGLANNPSALGEAATSASEYITSHIRTHSASLKVQTSRGNYLSSLTIRTEQVDFADDEASWERNMDDLILRAAIWQDEHWIDRSAILQSDGVSRDTTGAAKVVLLSFDRMLRLKARSRQLSAANEQDMASILAPSR